jgi:hypothetical protein
MELKSMLLMHSEPEEIARLRAKWSHENELRTRSRVEQIRGAEMNAVSTWLETLVEEKVDELRAARKRAVEEEAFRAEAAIKSANRAMRLSLGDEWMRKVETRIENGVAYFTHAGHEFCISQNSENKDYYLNNSVRLLDAAGGLAFRIVATLAADKNGPGSLQ